jgi:hypothetical protein
MRVWMAAKMWLWSYFTTWQRLVPTESLHTRRVGTFQEGTQPVTKRGNAPQMPNSLAVPTISSTFSFPASVRSTFSPSTHPSRADIYQLRILIFRLSKMDRNHSSSLEGCLLYLWEDDFTIWPDNSS